MNRNVDILQIIHHAIQSVRPSYVFPRYLENPPYPELKRWLDSPEKRLLCVGKAAIESAEVILSRVPNCNSFVLAPGPARETKVKARFGSHPVPDESSYQSTQELLSWLKNGSDSSRLLIVLSGGSSALLVSPIAGVSMDSTQSINDLLIRCGATIQEMNAVRKHLSEVKGGRLASSVARFEPVVLVISDVIGDDLSTIGSGPFYPDATTYQDASNVLHRYQIWDQAPEDVRRAISEGMEGRLPETSKAGESNIPHYIVASNELAKSAAAEKARSIGYTVQILSKPVYGMIEDVAENLVSFIRATSTRTALIAGGEITIRLRKSGMGGRNQHLTLLMTELLAGTDCCFAAAGTDGVDGNSPATGAWTDNHTTGRAMRKHLDLDQYVENFDSYHFFHELDQTIQTGPTGTNVMDLYIALT